MGLRESAAIREIADPNRAAADSATWRLLLEARLERIRTGLPVALRGALQFAFRGESDSSAFYLLLRGSESKIGSGFHPAATSWVELETASIARWIEGGAPAPVWVGGDASLARRTFEAFAAPPATTGWVGIQQGRAL